MTSIGLTKISTKGSKESSGGKGIFSSLLLRLSLAIALGLLSLSAAHAQQSMAAALQYHKAEVILRNYSALGQPDTDAAREQLAEALSYIGYAIDEDPNDSFLWFKKAQVHEYLGQWDASLSAYKQSFAIQARPESALSIATITIELGQYQDAILVLNSILRDAPLVNGMTFALTGQLISAYILDNQLAKASQLADQLVENDHSLVSSALLIAAHALEDQAIEPPTDPQDLRLIIEIFYDLVLEKDPIPQSLDGRQWTLGFEGEDEREYLREYYLPGESPENWTEMISLRVLKNDSSSPAKLMSEAKKSTLSSCSDTQWNSIKSSKKEPPMAQAQWQTSDSCPDTLHYYRTAKTVQIKQDVLAGIAYTTTNTNIDQQQRSLWVSTIAAVPLRQALVSDSPE